MEITFSKIFKIILSHLLVILLCAVLFGAAGYAYTKYTVEPSYSSSMKLMVVSTKQNENSVSDISAMRRIVNTYVEMLDSRDFYELIKEDCGYPYSPNELKSMITFTTKEESEAFNVTVIAPTEKECWTLINSLDKQSQQYIGNKYTQLTITAVESPDRPVQNPIHTVRNAVLMFLFGFVLMTVIFIIINETDVRIHSEKELAGRYELPILGVVPNFDVKKQRKDTKTTADKPKVEEETQK